MTAKPSRDSVEDLWSNTSTNERMQEDFLHLIAVEG
jgi:hypothetical protein